jgi:hypothetical protein
MTRKSRREIEAAVDDIDTDGKHFLADGWTIISSEEAPDREPDRVIDGVAFYIEEESDDE